MIKYGPGAYTIAAYFLREAVPVARGGAVSELHTGRARLKTH